jgi:sugar phosphate permease
VTSVLPGLILTTLGLGISLVPMTVAATAGVPPHEAGLAAGLLNTSRQIGGAIGLAALATIAANRTESAAASGASAQHALTLGYDRAHLVNAGIAIVAVLVALTLPKLARPKPSAEPELAAAEDEIIAESELETEAGAISDTLPEAEKVLGA